MIPIFLSRPNPFTHEQEMFLANLINLFEKQDLKNITLEAKEYNPYESLNCLNEIIKRCYGIIIVSFGQLYIEAGTSKKGALDNNLFFDSIEKTADQSWITSPFCQIEGALAFTNNIPIFILMQEDVQQDGILKKGSHAIYANKFSLRSKNEIVTYFMSESFITSFFMWQKKVKKLYNFINRTSV